MFYVFDGADSGVTRVDLFLQVDMSNSYDDDDDDDDNDYDIKK